MSAKFACVLEISKLFYFRVRGRMHIEKTDLRCMAVEEHLRSYVDTRHPTLQPRSVVRHNWRADE